MYIRGARIQESVATRARRRPTSNASQAVRSHTTKSGRIRTQLMHGAVLARAGGLAEARQRRH